MPDYTYSQTEVEVIAQHAALKGYEQGVRKGLLVDLPVMRADVLAKLKAEGLIVDGAK